MAARDTIAANAQPHLDPGEVVQAVIAAQTHPEALALAASGAFLALNEHRAIIVPDRRVLVSRSGKVSSTKVGEVLAELPRSTRIGPTTDGSWHQVRLGSEELRIAKRWYPEVAAADRLAT